MTQAVQTKAAHIYVCYGCGASLSTCADDYQSPDKREKRNRKHCETGAGRVADRKLPLNFRRARTPLEAVPKVKTLVVTTT